MITRFTPSEFKFIEHRLQAPDALIDVMRDAEDDEIAIYANTDLTNVFGGLELKLQQGCDLTQLTKIERWILVDCVEGSVLLFAAQDEEPYHRGIYGRTRKAAKGVVAKLAAAGIHASFPPG